MAREIKIRTRTQEGATEILVLVNHPMETGLAASTPRPKRRSRHIFIQELSIELNGKLMVSASLVSAYPRIHCLASAPRPPRKVTRSRLAGKTTRVRRHGRGGR